MKDKPNNSLKGLTLLGKIELPKESFRKRGKSNLKTVNPKIKAIDERLIEKREDQISLIEDFIDFYQSILLKYRIKKSSGINNPRNLRNCEILYLLPNFTSVFQKSSDIEKLKELREDLNILIHFFFKAEEMLLKVESFSKVFIPEINKEIKDFNKEIIFTNINYKNHQDICWDIIECCPLDSKIFDKINLLEEVEINLVEKEEREINKFNKVNFNLKSWFCSICDGDETTGCLYFDLSECPRHS